MLDVSIIIVNWNAQALLARCLRHVVDTVKRSSYEVIVIDNNSSDGSPDMVRRDFPAAILIANPDNRGFAAANNQGMAISQGRYVLLLNSDAFVEENTIDAMVAFMDQHPEAGMAACKLLYEDRSLQPSCSSFPTLETEFYTAVGLEKLFPNSPIFGKYLMRYWDYSDIRAVDVIMGAFMLVRRSAIDQVGMMDEGYFMYSEEVDWCYRFSRAGWKTLFNPHVQAVHLWGGTSKQVRWEMFVQLYRSRVRFFRRSYGPVSTFLLKVILALNCLVRIIPGALYYRRSGTPEMRQKHDAFRQLLAQLPGF